MEKGRQQIEEEVIDIAFFMRGGVTYIESWQLSQQQRMLIAERVSKHQRDMNGGPEYM